MKRWHILLMVTMALLTLLVSTPMPAHAQNEEPTAEEVKPALKGALAIVAPWFGFVGKELTMTVFLRENQEPFPGAGVWALTKEEAEALKGELAQLKEESNQPAGEQDYEAIIGGRGIFLGRTGDNGKLAYTFEQGGQYVLVAAKKGYFPGFTPLGVYTMPKALGIKATPPQAHVGKEVTLNVFDRQSSDPVQGAGVWAISRDNVEALKEGMTALREDKTAAAEKDYEAVVSAHGAFLGRTDADGKLRVTFSESGGYLLVAVKKGYIPGFTLMVVKEMPKPKPEEQKT